jgi:competence protein ComEC
VQAPALLVAVPLVAGAATAIVWFDSLSTGFSLTAGAAAALCLLSALGSFLQDDVEAASVALAAGALAGGLSIGATSADRSYNPPLLELFESNPPSAAVVLEGVLREDAVHTATGVSLTLDVTRMEGLVLPHPGGGARLSVGGSLHGTRPDAWRAGRTIRTPALLRHPSVYLNPGVPDERRALARRGIVLVGTIKSATLVEVLREGTISREAAAHVRQWTRARITRSMASLDPKSAGVTTAVLIGDRSGLAIEDERRLQAAGTYHVIAISGGNIAILAVLLSIGGRILLVPPRLAAVATAGGLLAYGMVAAGAASVERAVTVAVIVLAARALDHRGPPLNALALAAVIGVAVCPIVALDPAFMLSFGATVGILLGAGRLAPSRPRGTAGPIRRVGLALGTLLAATACAEIVLAPVAASLFGQVTFAGLLLNFVAIPLMTVVQVAGLVILATSSWIEPVASVAAVCGHAAALGLLQSARLVDLAPWLAVDVRAPAAWLVGAYYASVAGLFVAPVRRFAGAGFLVASGLLLGGPDIAARDAVPAASMPLRVVVLDVGQGDATLVAMPGGRMLLVDAGGVATFGGPAAEDSPVAFDIGERVLFPALQALGARRLHGLVVTHGDPDHLLGAEGLLKRLTTGAIWEGVPVPPHGGLARLMSLAASTGTAWRTVQPGDTDLIGLVQIRVLHPPLPEWERQRVRNDDSIVLEVRIGHVSIVLPGDIGEEGERAILERLEPGRMVVLKAPHHGSATSSTPALLERLRPVAVVFSCGRDNRFGHPHPAVVARYRALGTAMLSTADDGAVFVETDGERIVMRGWRGRQVSFEAPLQ